jgi:hypothetical protein
MIERKRVLRMDGEERMSVLDRFCLTDSAHTPPTIKFHETEDKQEMR